MVDEKIQQEILDIIKNPRLTHKQQLFSLAEYCENLCDYPTGTPVEEFKKFEAKRILCDHNDGHAPYSPRYILPDYDVFLKNGSEHLRLPAPSSFDELLNSLMILYCNIPSVTHYPVYAGRLDLILERFIHTVPEDEARKKVRLFLLQMDRIISDSFCHVNIGPEDTLAGRILVEELAKLNNPCPNMTLRYDPELTSDEFAEICIIAAMTAANPAFAFDPYFKERVGENYGIASCYNGLNVGGGAYSLSRMRLGPVAEEATNLDDFFNNVLPSAVDVACRFMEAKIKFIAEEIPFFKTNFLVKEGLIQADKFVGLFGLVGLNECVNVLMEKNGKSGKFGHCLEADELGVRIIAAVDKQVGEFESKYSCYGGKHFMMHAQVGACGDNGVTPGCRIAIGSEPDLYTHIRQAGLFHPYFPSGIGDIFPFETTAKNNPAAILDIIKGAFKVGVHYISVYSSDTDVIRVTGYLIKKSDMEKFRTGNAVINGSVSPSEETVVFRGTYDRKVESI